MGLDMIEVSSELADEIRQSKKLDVFDNMISALGRLKERNLSSAHLYKVIDAERDAFVGYVILL